MKSKQEQLWDCVTYYAIENWDKLCKKASCFLKGNCIPISVQLERKFKIDPCTSSRIARNVALMKHIGIVWKE